MVIKTKQHMSSVDIYFTWKPTSSLLGVHPWPLIISVMRKRRNTKWTVMIQTNWYYQKQDGWSVDLGDNIGVLWTGYKKLCKLLASQLGVEMLVWVKFLLGNH